LIRNQCRDRGAVTYFTGAISQYRLAKDISIPARRINESVYGKCAVYADTALRLGRFFGTPFMNKGLMGIAGVGSILVVLFQHWACRNIYKPNRRDKIK